MFSFENATERQRLFLSRRIWEIGIKQGMIFMDYRKLGGVFID